MRVLPLAACASFWRVRRLTSTLRSSSPSPRALAGRASPALTPLLASTSLLQTNRTAGPTSLEIFSERGLQFKVNRLGTTSVSSLEPLRYKRVIFAHVMNRQAPNGLSFIMVSVCPQKRWSSVLWCWSWPVLERNVVPLFYSTGIFTILCLSTLFDIMFLC